jgi:hypothetical protein
MKALLIIGTSLLAGSAWAQQAKVQPVVVTNPSLTVQAADSGRYTHVGQRPSRIVNLRVDSRTDTFGYLVNPATGFLDGLATSTPFQVPAGFLFVLTDIIGSGACTAGVSATLVLHQFLDTLPRERTVLNAVCPDSGSVVVQGHYTTGLLFGAGSSIVVGGFRNFVDIHGYLVPEG